MAESTNQGRLFDEGSLPDDGTVAVNQRCLLRTQDGYRLVLVAGLSIAHYAVGDRMAEAHAMVSLIDQGWASQVEVARAFGYTTRTTRRFERRFQDGGLAALGQSKGYPAGRSRLPAGRTRLVLRLKAEGLSNRAIAVRIGVTEKAVRKLLERLGWKKPRTDEPALPAMPEGADPKLSGFSTTPPEKGCREASPAGAEPPPGSPSSADPKLSDLSDEEELLPVTFDQDPADRRIDRLFACLGILDDAAPLFRTGVHIPRAGVLLAVPALLATGVLDCAREIYGTIGPAFYGLRTSILTLLLLALLRIKRAEGLKEHSPEDIGRLLGLDRAPEVKTLRRKLERLAGFGRAADFGRLLAHHRVAAHGAAVGFLYVDGHVRAYHGGRTIPKAHVARMRIAMPATTDYWVNDTGGEPLFVVTAEANAGLVKMLPGLLSDVRDFVGDRRVTIVFDRGGWSPKLFRRLLELNFDILTYRKGRSRRVCRRLFLSQQIEIDGRTLRYELADREIRLLDGSLRLRQVTRRSENGHQTPIVTSRRDLTAAEVAFRMFERWRQENFFKYLREEYALDALVDHGVEKANPSREVPNPHHRAMLAEIRRARGEVIRLSSLYGIEAITNPEELRRTMRGFKIAHAKEARALADALQRHSDLTARRARMPARIPVGEVVDGPVVRLATERKHLSNVLKAVAYQAETDLVRRIRPHYPRVEQEGRTLIQSALASAADFDVTIDELRITLAAQSSPHRTQAVAALCEDLNRSPVFFPGTRLKLRFAAGSPASNRTNP